MKMTNYRIRYAPWVPFVEIETDQYNKTFFEGIASEVYKGMKTFMAFNYAAERQLDNTYGTRRADGTWTGMIGSTLRNETDISGPYFVDEDRSRAVEFSVPLSFQQLAIVSGMVPTNRDTFLILRIFSLTIWVAMLVALVAVSATACLIYHVLPAPEKRGKLETFSKYLWAFQSCLVGKSFGENNESWFLRHVWSSPSFRLLQTVWFIGGCLVLMYTYQGAITSAFANDKLKPKISTIEELLADTGIDVCAYRNSYVQSTFSKLGNTRYEPLWHRLKKNLVTPPNRGENPIWLDWVEEGKTIFISDTLWSMNLVGERFLKTGKCGIRVIGFDLGASYMAFGFRRQLRNQSIFRKFSKGLRRFKEGGLEHRKITISTLYYDICTGESTAVTNPLKLMDVIGALMIFAVGNTLACVLLVLELLTNSKLKSRMQTGEVLLLYNMPLAGCSKISDVPV